MSPPATAAADTTVASAAEERRHLRAFLTDDETRKVVDQVVSDLMIPHASVQRGGVADAVRELGTHRSPRILLVDITDAELPLSAVNELAEVCEPGVTVIAIGDRNDVGLFRDLIGHGVSDYLVKPVTAALLQKSLLGVIDTGSQGRQANRLGRLIAVTGTRGGVGATLVATGVAWSIAHRRRRRVALVDLDLQLGTAALALDLEPTHGLREALEHPSRVDSLFVDRAMTRQSETLYVLSSEEPLGEALVPDYAALDVLLKELRNKFHFVIVDLPRQVTPCTQHVLQTATNLVLVTDLSLAGMRDALRYASLLPTVNASCQLSLCANRVGEHRQGEIGRREFESAVGRPIDVLVPFDAKTVAAATNVGQPVAAGRSAVAATVHEFAERLCGGPSSTQRRALPRWPLWRR
jgi:pilus assembly protein CpaE